MTTDPLLGSWVLVELARVVDGEGVSHPMGLDCVGQLAYAGDGRMSALLQQPGGPAPLLAYAGPYRTRPGQVVHVPEVCSKPGWIGTELVRTVSFVGEHLVLASPPRPSRSGRQVHERLTWRRPATPRPSC